VLATGSADGIKLIDLHRHELIWAVDAVKPRDLRFSHCGTFLIYANSHRVEVLDIQSKVRTTTTRVDLASQSMLKSVALSKDATTIACS